MKQGFHQYFRHKLHIYMLVQGRSGNDLTNKILSDDFNEFFLNNVHRLMGRISDNLNRNNSQYSQCPILLTWINFNPSMDKRLGYQIDDYWAITDSTQTCNTNGTFMNIKQYPPHFEPYISTNCRLCRGVSRPSGTNVLFAFQHVTIVL